MISSKPIFLVLPTITISFKISPSETRNTIEILEPLCGEYTIKKTLRCSVNNSLRHAQYFMHKRKMYGISESESFYIIFDPYRNKIIDFQKNMNYYNTTDFLTDFCLSRQMYDKNIYSIDLNDEIPKFMIIPGKYSDKTLIFSDVNCYVYRALLTIHPIYSMIRLWPYRHTPR